MAARDPTKPSQLRAILIKNCASLDKALHYAYDVGKKVLCCDRVEVKYHVETPYGHVFLVGVTTQVGEVGETKMIERT